jgi:hypothetical protein
MIRCYRALHSAFRKLHAVPARRVVHHVVRHKALMAAVVAVSTVVCTVVNSPWGREASSLASRVGSHSANLGTPRIAQLNSAPTDVPVDLIDPALSPPTRRFSGGLHTPFAFTLSGTESELSDTSFDPPASGMFDGTRTIGLGADDFILSALDISAGPAYFAADVTDGSGNIGSEASISRTIVTDVPEPASLVLFGSALLGFGFMCRRRPRRS